MAVKAKPQPTHTRTGKKPTVAIEKVGPPRAKDWLTKNHPGNRHLRPRKVAEYATNMDLGLWPLADHMVVFDTQDRLINGQHTLHGVVRSGKTIETVVCRNWPDAALLVFDGGMKRVTDDRFSMAGLRWPRGSGATVRRIFMGVRSSREGLSDARIDHWLKEGKNGEAFAHIHVPIHKRHAPAAVRAVIARAHIGKADESDLARFCSVFMTGMMADPSEAAAVLLRNFVINRDYASRMSGSGQAQTRLYLHAEGALDDFLEGSAVKKLEPATEELFPLPIDPVPAVAAEGD